ncbi:Vegetative incompatibility HET-E-1 [Fusarium albosuccineum]|uniref:Vegetative incompatibility HET-E-1 n=1 Tax=Fusarium albosuccineum TaxID=1237068 RepID=A0A8H4LFG1_9HYPO|nr:Vegetative incompatibility HET-E-1 [Fusarium albosuccineum]
MRLLNIHTLQLEFFAGHEVPRYAALSHVWGSDEATFEDICSVNRDDVLHLSRYAKLRQSCTTVRSLRLDYLWIDTCCIDKSSSAELSEAINSMFRWYAESAVCIAFLEDVFATEYQDESMAVFQNSRWFSRGWTLQELIAPGKVIFYRQDWKRLGDRAELKKDISYVTGIPEELLDTTHHMAESRKRQLHQVSVAEKMYWAARRETTRPEDIAYCLLGIFDINMPLLYGEGQAKAFKRLQEEIIKSTDDESIYAWRQPRYRVEGQHYWGLFADSPSAFDLDYAAEELNGLVPKKSKYLSLRSGIAPSMTNRGLELELALTPLPIDKSGTIFLAFLNCEFRRGQTSINPAIILQRAAWDKDSHFVRVRPDILALSMMNNVILPDELMNMMKKGEAQALKEAVPRQIFVPHDTPDLRYLKGFIFRTDLKGVKKDQKAAVRVRSRSPTWQLFAADSSPGSPEFYEINFDRAPAPTLESLQKPEVVGVHKAQVLGVLELDFNSSDCTQCLVVGIEPLLTNPFQTAPLYFSPWYAFEEQSRIAHQDFSGVLDKDQRRLEWKVMDVMKVKIGIESRYSSLFYSVALEMETRQRSITWF